MKIETKTTTGTKVELETKNGSCHVTIHHPSAGRITCYAQEWGNVNGIDGIISHAKIGVKRQRVCISVPKADYDAIIADITSAKEAAEASNREAAIAECPAGYVIARCNWRNGDLMSAQYETEDGVKVLDSDLLESHHGWFFVKAIYVAVAKAAMEAKEEKKAADLAKSEDHREKIHTIAIRTGKRQVLDSWVTDRCMECLDECSFDQATEWIYPDGTTKIEYTHLH